MDSRLVPQGQPKKGGSYVWSCVEFHSLSASCVCCSLDRRDNFRTVRSHPGFKGGHGSRSRQSHGRSFAKVLAFSELRHTASGRNRAFLIFVAGWHIRRSAFLPEDGVGCNDDIRSLLQEPYPCAEDRQIRAAREDITPEVLPGPGEAQPRHWFGSIIFRDDVVIREQAWQVKGAP